MAVNAHASILPCRFIQRFNFETCKTGMLETPIAFLEHCLSKTQGSLLNGSHSFAAGWPLLGPAHGRFTLSAPCTDNLQQKRTSLTVQLADVKERRQECKYQAKNDGNQLKAGMGIHRTAKAVDTGHLSCSKTKSANQMSCNVNAGVQLSPNAQWQDSTRCVWITAE